MNKYHKFNEVNSNIILTCEHASPFIPDGYDNLGLSEEELKGAKDLYDEHALTLMLEMAKSINASTIYTEFSRLFIDANRLVNSSKKNDNEYHAPCLKTKLLTEINGEEKFIPIASNINVASNEESLRWNEYVLPYLKEVMGMVERINQRGEKAFLVQIHTFYPVYNGDIRSIEISLVHDNNEKTVRMLEILNDCGYIIGDNNPWDYSHVASGLFSILDPKGVAFTAYDIKSSNLEDPDELKKIAKLLASTISQVC